MESVYNCCSCNQLFLTFLVQRNKESTFGVLFLVNQNGWSVDSWYEYFHGMVWIFMSCWISIVSVIVLKRSSWLLSLTIYFVFMETLKSCGACAINGFLFIFLSSIHLYWKIKNFILRGSCPSKCRERPDIKGLSNCCE